jgi:hypothetical protein
MKRPNCELKETRPQPATHVLQKRAETKCREKSVCIRCRERDALEYPAGHGGQLCGECDDLQKREHGRWES